MAKKKSTRRRPKKTRARAAPPAKRRLHQDWRTWVVVAVMLLAIGTYVVTLDDSVQPGNSAAAGAATPAR